MSAFAKKKYNLDYFFNAKKKTSKSIHYILLARSSIWLVLTHHSLFTVGLKDFTMNESHWSCSKGMEKITQKKLAQKVFKQTCLTPSSK